MLPYDTYGKKLDILLDNKKDVKEQEM